MDPTLHTCAPHACTPYCRHDPAIPRARRGDKGLTIDLHCHMLAPKVEAMVAGLPQKQAERGLQVQAMGAASVTHNETAMFPGAAGRLTSIQERLADMDAMGVDLQVVSPSPTQYYYWAEEALAEAIVSEINENIAQQCARAPKQLMGLGSVALQHPALAVAQLRDAVGRLGLRGVEISSLARNQDLDAPALEPFWKAASDLGCIVFLHPLGTTVGERLNLHYLSNLIGQPLENTIALSRLIFSGVLERHTGVRLLAAHGGGYLPPYIGRSMHGSAVRPETGHAGQTAPLALLQRIWIDSLVFEPRILRHLIDTLGASRIVIGTDYPFDMGDYDIHAFIDAVPDISAEEKRMILGGNAAALLGLTQAQASPSAPSSGAATH